MSTTRRWVRVISTPTETRASYTGANALALRPPVESNTPASLTNPWAISSRTFCSTVGPLWPSRAASAGCEMRPLARIARSVSRRLLCLTSRLLLVFCISTSQAQGAGPGIAARRTAPQASPTISKNFRKVFSNIIIITKPSPLCKPWLHGGDGYVLCGAYPAGSQRSPVRPSSRLAPAQGISANQVLAGLPSGYFWLCSPSL